MIHNKKVERELERDFREDLNPTSKIEDRELDFDMSYDGYEIDHEQEWRDFQRLRVLGRKADTGYTIQLSGLSSEDLKKALWVYPDDV